ncbi:uncharacterized protein EDB91DRAFT_1147201 [Suillus paluster]|uniref:uncharacterized protein n=1 Tax=Suillus paluster TaxID=48578 RepID=UPI001B883EF1|nr:uncharacterized protein EDB91DRAFT_1147201 [Suillus paluster]KAG1734272.1 hypothetical protein EDB91DRAFT_1147201 [Suillus paluster]
MVQSNCGGPLRVTVQSQHTTAVHNRHPHQHAGMSRSHKVHQSMPNSRGHRSEMNDGIREKGRMRLYQCEATLLLEDALHGCGVIIHHQSPSQCLVGLQGPIQARLDQWGVEPGSVGLGCRHDNAWGGGFVDLDDLMTVAPFRCLVPHPHEADAVAVGAPALLRAVLPVGIHLPNE